MAMDTIFVQHWGDAFENARHIIHMLGEEQEILDHMGMGTLVEARDLEARQDEWIRLCGRFHHPHERDFFKPWWIPIEKGSLSLFLDLSDENFPVFRTHYLFVDPMQWYSEPVVDEISQLLLARDVGYDLEALKKRNERIARNRVDNIFREKVDMVFKGELEVEPLDREEFEMIRGEDLSFEENFLRDFHSVKGIKPLVMGLLPYNLPVVVREISVHHGERPRRAEEASCIRDLVFLIRHAGQDRIASLFVETLGEKPGSFAWFDSELTIVNPDKSLMQDFFKRLSSLMEEA